ncbi:polyketide cyclase [Archangium sp. Cb G35]|uniref:SRPBCC family protein n=1 Tax=Archangium sp. Cb G35 TaxID=1920190 RepID=UPI000936DC4C|nr:SRPBCC family protein [Archangium sp. Cb G35]OJT24137.1 polyketide cyclase [Archangium sp. Cb G35]
MLKKILLGVVGIIVALCGVIAMQPATYTVQRSATFKAAPDITFALVNDFHNWGGWSPWDKLDPNQKTTFEGAATGVGAKYGWSGNDQVGEGRMEIEESKSNELVRIKLEFIRPFASTSPTTFTFSPAAEGVTVTWKMDGTNDFMGKAFSLFVNMDAMLGADFDKGLAAMGKIAEAETQKRAEAEAAAKLAAEKAAAEAAAAAAPVEGQPAPAGGQTVAAPTP